MIREYIVKISSEVIEDEFKEHPQELVRCNNCIFHNVGENEVDAWNQCRLHNINTNDDEFCSWAVKKND